MRLAPSHALWSGPQLSTDHTQGGPSLQNNTSWTLPILAPRWKAARLWRTSLQTLQVSLHQGCSPWLCMHATAHCPCCLLPARNSTLALLTTRLPCPSSTCAAARTAIAPVPLNPTPLPLPYPPPACVPAGPAPNPVPLAPQPLTLNSALGRAAPAPMPLAPSPLGHFHQPTASAAPMPLAPVLLAPVPMPLAPAPLAHPSQPPASAAGEAFPTAAREASPGPAPSPSQAPTLAAAAPQSVQQLRRSGTLAPQRTTLARGLTRARALAQRSGGEQLLEAAKEGNVQLVRQLLQQGVGPDTARDTEEGNTALLLAAREGQVEVAGLLLKGGADVDMTNSDGETAAHHAATLGHVPMLHTLCDWGADLTIRCFLGLTPLDRAKRVSLASHSEAEKLLKKATKEQAGE